MHGGVMAGGKVLLLELTFQELMLYKSTSLV